ncbi:MAG: hypothetical protein HY718_09285, partial [Planctomycetes bacterium]|nr:hypothetical protein [Planctomycetota bacterium]
QYARDHYGADDAAHMAKVHLRLEEFGPQYVGARGTVECASNGFKWFWEGQDPMLKHEPNLAAGRPSERRFPELDAMVQDLTDRGVKAAAAGRQHAATQYHDLAMTIHWLVRRARVGLAIWGEKAPLEQRLREAEESFWQGQTGETRKAAAAVLAELEKLDFRSAMQALASTCRTRGELGMLTTANARYGRYYATFVQRIAYILGKPLPEARGCGAWTGPEVTTVFLVPNSVPGKEPVVFDAVLLPKKATVFAVELTRLDDPQRPTERLGFERLGGAYHRATFAPGTRGTWAWRLTADGKPASAALGTTNGVVCRE